MQQEKYNDMNTFSTEHQIAEYLLVLEPHEALKQTIQSVKQYFADQYDCPAAVYSKPHITILKCMQFCMAESRWIPKLQRIVATAVPFMVELENFGNFPTHTIYIQVKTKNQIVELVKSLKEIQSLIKLDKEHKPHFVTEPHLSIARQLQHWQFEQGWREYGNSEFSGRFMADHVLLMRKRVEEKKYEVIGRFAMSGIQQTVEQMQLFNSP